MNHFFIFLFFLIFIHHTSINASEIIDDNDTEDPTQLIDGQPIIFMDETTQKISGIKALKVNKTKLVPEMVTYGKVISVSPLLTVRHNYLSAIIQKNASATRLAQVEKSMFRLRNLHKNKVVSIKKLQIHQSQWHSEKAIHTSKVHQSNLILARSKLQWGELLTHWATDEHSPQFDKLINGESNLLKLSILANNQLSKINKINISPTGNRNTKSEAFYVCTLPQIDNFSQSPQHIFLSHSTKIKIGMNITAWIPQQIDHQLGIIIPTQSLAWHLGQPFVFVKLDKEHFTHRSISHPIKVPNGYYIADQLKEGKKVVISGVQMLLSHEFRSQIPDEDDD